MSRADLASRLAREGRLEVIAKNMPLWRKLYKPRFLIRVILYTTFTRWWGRANALDLQVEYNTLELPELPDALLGFRLLHLSDLHLDANAKFADVMAEQIAHLEVDMTVITGDFRARTFGSCEPVLEFIRKLAPRIPCVGESCIAILGNHDSITVVPELESLGIQFLVNESIRIDVNNESILLAGTDDPYTFRAADLVKCLQTDPLHVSDLTTEQSEPVCRAQDLNIALVHTPQLAKRASKAGFDIYLTGHTHGGQVCWPWRKPIDPKIGIEKKYVSGRWQEGAMIGHTSRGSGTSIVDARFFCPPEVTVHTLARAAKNT